MSPNDRLAHDVLQGLVGIHQRMDAHHRLMEKIMSILDDLTVSVSKQGTVISSATALISGLSAKLEQAIAALPAGTDTTALTALKTEVDAQTAALASAVATGTVAAAEAMPPAAAVAAAAAAPAPADTTTAPPPAAPTP